MRNDPGRLSFEIKARDGSARAGLIRSGHGEVATPAFIPLATKASVRGLSAGEVAALGYQLVLGNTFHLHLSPGEDRIAAHGGLHGFMGWDRALITDSGGFQVFSLAHGGVADEIKGRRGSMHGEPEVEISERGVSFRSLLDGSNHFLGPEESMAIQAKLGADIALAFDECTPYHADREYTARSTERTHRWLDRCLEWHQQCGPAGQAVFGIVQGGVYGDLRRESAARIGSAQVDGIAIGGTLGRDKDEMHGVLEATLPHLPDESPRHLLGIGEVDDLIAGIGLGIEVFDCAVPTRLARHGTALVPDPDGRFRLDLTKARYADDDAPLVEGCPCEACREGYSRAYLHYLARAQELTGARLLTLHNLTYVERLVAAAREAIDAQSFAAYARAILGGATPWAAR
ncbi:MAG TPA: tRNA guanosine(34) transglycosylase Tgt [Solirubrobacterales bacterium]|nr:tRNA guanosine(34) transglycosylase Tgt [Solirubrobacterales bacterium]